MWKNRPLPCRIIARHRFTLTQLFFPIKSSSNNIYRYIHNFNFYLKLKSSLMLFINIIVTLFYENNSICQNNPFSKICSKTQSTGNFLFYFWNDNIVKNICTQGCPFIRNIRIFKPIFNGALLKIFRQIIFPI